MGKIADTFHVYFHEAGIGNLFQKVFSFSKSPYQCIKISDIVELVVNYGYSIVVGERSGNRPSDEGLCQPIR